MSGLKARLAAWRQRLGLGAAARVRKSYAHSGEDLVLCKLMKPGRGGVYVDIGCHHPVHFSNTYLLYRRFGWQGLAVDADPRHLPLYARLRPRDRVMHVGIAATAGEAVFYNVPADGALNTFCAEEAARLRARGFDVVEMRVETLPLSDLLARHAVQHVDLLNVDVEGFDLAVLQSNDWSRWQPRFIAVEDHGLDLDQPDSSATHRFLREQGYRLRSRCNYTSIYQHAPAQRPSA